MTANMRAAGAVDWINARDPPKWLWRSVAALVLGGQVLTRVLQGAPARVLHWGFPLGSDVYGMCKGAPQGRRSRPAVRLISKSHPQSCMTQRRKHYAPVTAMGPRGCSEQHAVSGWMCTCM